MDWNNFFGLEKRNNQQPISYVSSTQTINTKINYGAMNLGVFFACLNLISEGVAALPVEVKKKTTQGKTSVVKNHPVNLLFSDKNNNLSKFTFFKLLIQSVILKGNGFAYIQRAADGTPVKLRYLESGDVIINYDKVKDELFYSSPLLKKNKIDKNDMLHFIKHTYNGINGISLLTYCRRSLDIANNTEDTAEKFFNNGASVSGVIQLKNQASKEQREQILSSWNQTYSNGGKGLTVVPANMEYHQIQVDASDAQMLESREYNVADICRFMGVNPALLGLKGYATFSTLEQVMQEFMQHTLLPYVIMMEEEFARKLLNENEGKLKVILDLESSLRATKGELASYLTTLHQNAIMSTNECRTILGLPSIEGGDEVLALYSDTTQNAIGNNSTTNTEE